MKLRLLSVPALLLCGAIPLATPQDVAAAEVVRLGSPPNPLAFVPGRTSGPVIGETWDPAMDLANPLLDGAAVDFVLFGPGGAFNATTPLGTLLCAPPRKVLSVAAGASSIPVPIPDDLSLIGVQVCTQGGAIAPGPEFALANALDVTIGSIQAQRLISCSLGCVPLGAQVSCGVTDVFVNEEVRFSFERPVDLSSVTNQTLQVVDVFTGQTPPFSVRLDPFDPTVLIWTPALQFDSNLDPVFGLQPDATYQLRIPGAALDSGPYLTDLGQGPNQTRLACTLVASRGIRDLNPGAPTATVTVDVVTGYDMDGNPVSFDLDVPADGAVDVWSASTLRLRFDDIALARTLVPPLSMDENVRVELDPDGDLSDASDRTPVAGVFSISYDLTNAASLLEFQPLGPWPAPDASQPNLRVVVTLEPGIQDLAGNGLANPGVISFVPEDGP